MCRIIKVLYEQVSCGWVLHRFYNARSRRHHVRARLLFLSWIRSLECPSRLSASPDSNRNPQVTMASSNLLVSTESDTETGKVGEASWGNMLLTCLKTFLQQLKLNLQKWPSWVSGFLKFLLKMYLKKVIMARYFHNLGPHRCCYSCLSLYRFLIYRI